MVKLGHILDAFWCVLSPCYWNDFKSFWIGVLFPKSALQYLPTKLWKRTPFLNQTKLFNLTLFKLLATQSSRGMVLESPLSLAIFITKEGGIFWSFRGTPRLQPAIIQFPTSFVQDSFVHAERWERKAPYLPAKPSPQTLKNFIHPIEKSAQ